MSLDHRRPTGPSVPTGRLAPATRAVSIPNPGPGIPGGFDGGGFLGEYRYMFIEQKGVSSSRLVAREAASLRTAGWRLVRTLGKGRTNAPPHVGTPGSVSELKSSAAGLHVTFAMVNSLSDAEGQSEGAIGLTRAIKQAVGHEPIEITGWRAAAPLPFVSSWSPASRW